MQMKKERVSYHKAEKFPYSNLHIFQFMLGFFIILAAEGILLSEDFRLAKLLLHCISCNMLACFEMPRK